MHFDIIQKYNVCTVQLSCHIHDIIIILRCARGVVKTVIMYVGGVRRGWVPGRRDAIIRILLLYRCKHVNQYPENHLKTEYESFVCTERAVRRKFVKSGKRLACLYLV